MDTLASVFRPRIGLGVGTMTYYGEVQNYQKGFVPMVNRYFGQAYVNAPITRYFNLEFSASYGKIAANERSLYENLNFQSRIRMGTVQLYYNFYPFFTNRRSLFHPFVGTGISSFEFLSKTDMYDADGNQYHYWSDGSIMNMAEDDPQAYNAIPLQRDYVYETDLREQNLDSLGDYKEQSFSIPLTAGIEFHLSPRWDFRIATTYHLTFTDLIDNITPAGQGIERHGDSKNDKLWTTYVSLSYDLQFPKDGEVFDPLDDSDVPLYADFDNSDWDEDGVIDAHDECPDTPLEALVDDKGCPLDGDMDGVPDYKDDEPDTPEGNWVDEYGVTLSEEDIAKHWREYMDSTGYDHDFVEERLVVEFGKEGIPSFNYLPRPKKNQSYVIIIGKEHKDIQANELHKYLGYNDFKTEQRGDTVYYILGEYDKIEDAVAYANALQKEGVEVELIGRDGSNDSTFYAVDQKVIEKVDKSNEEHGVTATIERNDEKVFRIQLGAFTKKVDIEKSFPNIDNVTYVTGEDGFTRYYTGKFNNYVEANEYRKKMISKGYRSAFVVAYEGGQRRTLQDLGIDPNELPDNYNEESELSTFTEEDKNPTIGNPTNNTDTTTTNNNIVNGIDLTKVKYRINLMTVPKGENLDAEVLNVLRNLEGGVMPYAKLDGQQVYYSKKQFKTEQEAEAAIKDFEIYGLENMTVNVEYDGKFYTPEEFQNMLKP